MTKNCSLGVIQLSRSSHRNWLLITSGTGFGAGQASLQQYVSAGHVACAHGSAPFIQVAFARGLLGDACCGVLVWWPVAYAAPDSGFVMLGNRMATVQHISGSN